MSISKLAPRRTHGLIAGAASLLAAMASPGAALAQDKPQYYQVEVVVFLQPAGISAERPPLPAMPAATGGPAAADESPAPQGVAAPDGRVDAAPEQSVLPPGFAPPRAERSLDAAARALSRRGYDVLWHQAWVQPPAQRQGSDLALLAALGQGPAQPGLTGSVSLSTGRFLHLGVALEWQVDGALAAKMDQRRRIRPDAEHYFDHPRLGVLAVIRRVDQSGVDQSESALSPAADVASPASASSP
ncbi:CsiV family protein [Thioalkalivibrio sp. XN279]|uniref:CsiV family protein n=1 Tax=Thioalkalivibrio sp. XN279 TaxID=2714953 RepID=UPI00140AB78A|nr:CsiV family protein [Thioalkalivibrio sp. XN279]NHA15240.1 hypothetical protein [Thioalkalivibrio sp. XN279]